MPDPIRDFIRRNLVADVPAAMDLCLSCKQPNCSAERFRNCARRLQRQADIEAAQQPQPASATTRSTSSA
jgi:hypothetical protein